MSWKWIWCFVLFFSMEIYILNTVKIHKYTNIIYSCFIPFFSKVILYFLNKAIAAHLLHKHSDCSELTFFTKTDILLRIFIVWITSIVFIGGKFNDVFVFAISRKLYFSVILGDLNWIIPTISLLISLLIHDIFV